MRKKFQEFATEPVCVVWIDKHVEPDEEGAYAISVLTGYEGLRLSEKDKYDARLDMGRDREKDGPLPFFSNFREAMAYMVAHKGEQIQIPAWQGSKLFSV